MVDISLQKTTDSPTIFLFSATWISTPRGPWPHPVCIRWTFPVEKPMDDEWMADANGWYMAIYTKRGLNHIYQSPFQLLQIYYELDDLVIIHQVPIWNVNFMGILLIQKQLKECATEYCTSMRWKKRLYHCINLISKQGLVIFLLINLWNKRKHPGRAPVE